MVEIQHLWLLNLLKSLKSKDTKITPTLTLILMLNRITTVTKEILSYIYYYGIVVCYSEVNLKISVQ